MKRETENNLSLSPQRLLQLELERRCTKNPRYSLRSFAKALGLSHTVLSLVLSGKRPLSKKAIHQVAQQLDLDPAQKQKLLDDKIVQRRRTPVSPVIDYQQISLDVFSMISDWVHYATLSLLEIKGARFEARWIAKQLGVTEMRAKLAMERLVRLEMVVQEKNGKWKQSGKPLKVENTVSTESTREFHKQVLNRAIESLENDPIEVRDFSAMTLAIDPALIPYAKERIRAFRRELTQELESKGAPKRVYNLTVQIYPVSKSVSQ